MFNEFLNWYWSEGKFSGVKQRKHLFYYRGIDWEVTQNLAIDRILNKGGCEKFVREPIVYKYWNEESNEIAELKLKENISDLLFKL